MFDDALRIAADVNGCIVGGYAIRNIVPDWPCDIIDIVGTKEWETDLPVTTQRTWLSSNMLEWKVHPSGRIRVATWYTLLSGWEFSMENCRYDADGTYHASDVARNAAASRTLSTSEPFSANDIAKLEKRGFKFGHLRCTYAVYDEKLLDSFSRYGRIDIYLDRVLVDNAVAHILATYKFCNVVMLGCIVYMGVLWGHNSVRFRNCMIGGTECHGSVHVDGTNCGWLYSVDPSGAKALIGNEYTRTITRQEEEDRAKIYLEFLDGLAPDMRAYEIADVIASRDHIESPAYFRVLCKYKTIYDKYVSGYCHPMIQMHVLAHRECVFPSEWITEIHTLIEATKYGVCKPRHPFFAQCMFRIDRQYVTDDEAFVNRPLNNIMTFVHDTDPAPSKWYNIMPRYPCRWIVGTQAMYLPLDQIDDKLNGEGYTVEMMDMLIDQILTHDVYKAELGAYLLRRGDAPPYLRKLLSRSMQH